MASAFPSSSGDVDSQSPAAEKPKKDTDTHISIRVIDSDRTKEIHFRLRPDVQLSRMKRAFGQKYEINEQVLRFVFDGHRITDHDTPRSLGMENDDIVDVYQEATGGGMLC